MTMAAAEKTSMQRARQKDVVNKLARPDEHWSVFEARNRFADHHDLPLKRRSLACGRIRASSSRPGNDLAIRWDLARNTSHVTPRRLRRSRARHRQEDVRHAFRRRGSYQMSSAPLRFGHNALRLPSKSYGNVSKGATQYRPSGRSFAASGLPFGRQTASTVYCDGHNGPANARHAMPLRRSTASRSLEYRMSAR